MSKEIYILVEMNVDKLTIVYYVKTTILPMSKEIYILVEMNVSETRLWIGIRSYLAFSHFLFQVTWLSSFLTFSRVCLETYHAMGALEIPRRESPKVTQVGHQDLPIHNLE
jgi:hypothetical protein